MPIPHVVKLVNLTYLSLDVMRTGGPSLLAALDAMPALRALELQNVEPGVVDDFPAHCPQLEHFSLKLVDFIERSELQILDQVGQYLVHLRSLRVNGYRIAQDGYGAFDWSWLHAVAVRGQLEYVHLFYTTDLFDGRIEDGEDDDLPAAVAIVRNCKASEP